MTHTSTLSAPHPDRLKEFSEAADVSRPRPELVPWKWRQSLLQVILPLDVTLSFRARRSFRRGNTTCRYHTDTFISSLTVEKMPSRIDCERSCSGLAVTKAMRLGSAACMSQQNSWYVISSRVTTFLATGNRRRKRGLHSGRMPR